MPQVVHSPEQAAQLLAGISVKTLVGLLRTGGYSYVELSPGAKPWGRGRRAWGLTDSQIAAIIAGQTRKIQTPEHEKITPKPRTKTPALFAGHDGKVRLRRVNE